MEETEADGGPSPGLGSTVAAPAEGPPLPEPAPHDHEAEAAVHEADGAPAAAKAKGCEPDSDPSLDAAPAARDKGSEEAPKEEDPSEPSVWATAAPPRSPRYRGPCDSWVRAVRDFPHCATHCPLTFAILSILASFVFAGAYFKGITVITDFSTFLVADGRAMEVSTAVGAAKAKTGAPKRMRRLQPKLQAPQAPSDQLYDVMELRLMYKATGGGLLTMPALQGVRQVETTLRALPGWRAICSQTAPFQALCEPGWSVTSVVWPAFPDAGQSTEQQFVKCNLTGKGGDPLDLSAAREVIRNRNMVAQMFPSDYQDGVNPSLLSTKVEFRLWRCVTADCAAGGAKSASNLKMWKTFLSDELFPKLNELRQLGNPNFELFWHGSYITDLAVWEALEGDAMLAVGASVFVMGYLAFHSRSLLFSTFTLLLTALGIPLAFVSMSAISGSHEIGGASLLALFLTIGLGADVALVFVAWWDNSLTKFDATDYPSRIKYMNLQSGSACLVTSLTTAASFFSNMTSALKALREFGFFLGACMIWSFVFIYVGLPPVLIARDFISRKCCSCKFVGDQMRQLKGALGRELEGLGDRCSLGRRTKANLFVTYFLQPCRIPVTVLSVIVPVLLTIWTLQNAKVDGGSPQMFPSDNNEYQEVQLFEKFPVQDYPTLGTETYICNVGQEVPSRSQDDCSLNWCELEHFQLPVDVYGSVDKWGNTTCSCKPVAVPGRSCTTTAITNVTVRVRVTSRIVGLTQVPDGFWTSSRWKDHVEEAVRKANGMNIGFTQPTQLQVNQERKLSSLAQMNWETGTSRLVGYRLAPDSFAWIRDYNGRWCHVEEVCYCGTPACKLWQERQDQPRVPQEFWSNISFSNPPADSRRLECENDAEGGGAQESRLAAKLGEQLAVQRASEGRSQGGGFLPLQRLFSNRAVSSPSSAPARRLAAGTSVLVIWGIKVLATSPALGESPGPPWAYDTGFRPESPAVQRHLLRACTDLNAQEFSLLGTKCWIDKFRDWQKKNNDIFPVSPTRFHALVVAFAKQAYYDGWAPGNMLWFSSDGLLLASMHQFSVDFSTYTASLGTLVSRKAQWDSYVDSLNQNAPFGADQAFHQCDAWVREEAESSIVTGTVQSMVLSMVMSYFGALIMTPFDWVLAGFSLVAVIDVTFLLAYTMLVVLGWKLGAIEVLGLIIFVGNNITYNMHIAYKYRENMKALLKQEGLTIADRRREAVIAVLETMTMPLMGSMCTTLGSTMFLFFCTITIFVKTATILFVVQTYATIYAVIVLPASLLWVGPDYSVCGEVCFKQLAWRCCGRLLRRFRRPAADVSAASLPAPGAVEDAPAAAASTPTTPRSKRRTASAGADRSPSRSPRPGPTSAAQLPSAAKSEASGKSQASGKSPRVRGGTPRTTPSKKPTTKL